MFDWENPSPERPDEFRGFETLTTPPDEKGGWRAFQQAFNIPTLEQIRDRKAPHRGWHIKKPASVAGIIDPGESLPEEYLNLIGYSLSRQGNVKCSEIGPGTAPRSVRSLSRGFNADGGWTLEYRTPRPVPTPGPDYTCTRPLAAMKTPIDDRLPDLGRFILRYPADHPAKTCALKYQARQFEMQRLPTFETTEDMELFLELNGMNTTEFRNNIALLMTKWFFINVGDDLITPFLDVIDKCIRLWAMGYPLGRQHVIRVMACVL